MIAFNNNEHPHRRYNPLLDEWVLVSPHRAKRPWQGQNEPSSDLQLPAYDQACYLCPRNMRSNGEYNPDYNDVFVFDNDFPALLTEKVEAEPSENEFFTLKPEQGINKVICFSPRHDLTIPELELESIENIIRAWIGQYIEIGNMDFINYVQIFENKGAVMGCSNPHPHGQIWAQSSLPTEIVKLQESQLKYYRKNGRSLLSDYSKQELERKERVVLENAHFIVVVPFWAVWPFEVLLISKRHLANISEFTDDEIKSYASILKVLTIKYDNLFQTSFPYSAGIHQAPTDGKSHDEWHFHMNFYPPLLRSATIKKFMVGYEMLAESQRDITPEKSAEMLRNLPEVHYKQKTS
ncbi:MAG: UDP-glucose--hexose-1-phosphate uridylyltransferase [Flavobacterium sp.]|nr:UDP-glucose--hexose-1-phosphate uridylyltransferase [Flavobacterium sp.]